MSRLKKIKAQPDRRGLFLMRQAARLLEPGRLDAVVTTILLIETGDFEVWSSAIKSVQMGTCRIDARLMSELYRVCPPRLKPMFASAHATSYLEPKDFHPIFTDAYARKMSASERRDLAATLSAFLRHNPEERLRYRPIILELLRSRQQDPCLLGKLLLPPGKQCPWP